MSNAVFKPTSIVSFLPRRRIFLGLLELAGFCRLSLATGVTRGRRLAGHSPFGNAGVGQDPVAFILDHDLGQGQSLPVHHVKFVVLGRFGDDLSQLLLHFGVAHAGNLVLGGKATLHVEADGGRKLHAWSGRFRRWVHGGLWKGGSGGRWVGGFIRRETTTCLDWDIGRSRWSRVSEANKHQRRTRRSALTRGLKSNGLGGWRRGSHTPRWDAGVHPGV